MLKQSHQTLHDFLSKARETPGESSLAGEIFEAMASAVLANGGVFPVRRLRDGLKGMLTLTAKDGFHVDLVCPLPSQAASSGVSGPSISSKAVSSSPSSSLVVVNNNVCSRPLKRLRTEIDDAFTSNQVDDDPEERKVGGIDAEKVGVTVSPNEVIFGNVAEVGSIPERVLARPSFRTLVGVDAFVKPDTAFQITVANKHPIKIGKFNSQVAAHLKSPLRFFFVVPSQETFDSFELQTYQFNPAKRCPHSNKVETKSCKDCAIKDKNLDQYVMHLPFRFDAFHVDDKISFAPH